MKLLTKFPIVLICLLNAQQFVPIMDIDQDAITRRDDQRRKRRSFTGPSRPDSTRGESAL